MLLLVPKVSDAAGGLDVPANATFGSSSTDTFTVLSTAFFRSPATAAASLLVRESLTVYGNTALGTATGGQTLIINAATTIAGTAGPVTINVAVLANQGLTAAGTVALSGNTVMGSPAGGQTLAIHAATVFTPAAGAVTANAPFTANSDLLVRGLFNASGNAVIGSGSGDSLAVNAEAVFAALLQLTGEWPVPSVLEADYETAAAVSTTHPTYCPINKFAPADTWMDP